MDLGRQVTSLVVERRRSLPLHPNDHNFGSLIILAVTGGAFLLVAWVATKGLPLTRSSTFPCAPI